MPQYVDTSSCTRLDTEIKADVEAKAEDDRSASSSLSMHESEVIGCGRDVLRAIPHTGAHAREATNAHYPRQTDIVTPGSVTPTSAQSFATSTSTSLNTNIGSGVAELRQVLGLTSVPRAGSRPAETTEAVAFDQVSHITIPYGSSSDFVATSSVPPRAYESNDAHTLLSSSQKTSIGGVGGVAGWIGFIGIAVLIEFCIARWRAWRRYADTGRTVNNTAPVNENRNENSSSSSQADLGITLEDGTHVVVPDDHGSVGEVTSTSSAPPLTATVSLSTTAIAPSVPLSNIPPTSPPIAAPSTSRPRPLPGVPVHTTPAHANSYPDPNQYLNPYPHPQRDPYRRHHSDCYSGHEIGTPCPAYSCISLSENNRTIGSVSLRSIVSSSSRWHGRDDRERRGGEGEGEGEGRRDGGEGRTGGGNRSGSRNRAIARRTNIPPRSMTRASARTWMTRSDRSGETAPPSYDFANGPPTVHQ